MPDRIYDNRRYVEVRPGEYAQEVVIATGGGANRVASASASVAGGNTFATVVDLTPAANITIIGYSADFQAILSTNYRLRLITGTDAAPTILHEEVVATTASAWMPIKVDIPAGTRIAVQVAHGEAVAQSTEATLNYQE